MILKTGEDYLLFTRIFILVYCIHEYIMGNNFNTEVVILALLYVIFNTLIFIFIKKKHSLICTMFSIVISILCGLRLDSIFLILIPMNFFDIVFINRYSFIYGIVAAVLFAFLLPKKILSLYVLLFCLLLLLYILIQKYLMKIQKLLIENDELREKSSKYIKEIEHITKYERQAVYTSQLEERNSLSQQMHDKIGHTLASSLMQLEASKLLIDSDKDKAKKIIESTINVLRVGMEEIRQTLRKIKPPSEQLGINRVKLILEESTKSTVFKYSLTFKGEIGKLQYSQWKAICESTVESVTNAIKYSYGNKIDVSIYVLNKVARVEIKDNGIGAKNVTKGLGLIGIEQRCIDLGGNAIFDGNDGFRMTMILPL